MKVVVLKDPHVPKYHPGASGMEGWDYPEAQYSRISWELINSLHRAYSLRRNVVDVHGSHKELCLFSSLSNSVSLIQTQNIQPNCGHARLGHTKVPSGYHTPIQ